MRVTFPRKRFSRYYIARIVGSFAGRRLIVKFDASNTKEAWRFLWRHYGPCKIMSLKPAGRCTREQ